MSDNAVKNEVGLPALGNIVVCSSYQTETVSSPSNFDLNKWELLGGVKKILSMDSNHRWTTCFCMQNRRFGVENIDILYSPEKMKAYYSGLQTCKSAWNCPLCALRISIERQKEIADGLSRVNGSIAHVVFTIQHNLDDMLDKLRIDLAGALNHVFSGNRAGIIYNVLGLRGYLRGYENKHSPKTGWHIHAHYAFVFKDGVVVDEEAVKKFLYDTYGAYLARRGYLVNGATINFELKDSESISEEIGDYLTKDALSGYESISWELTGAEKKEPKRSLTPFQLVRAFLETGDYKYAGLFAEHATVMYRKKKIHWSRKLKKELFPEGTKSANEILDDSRSEIDLLLASLSIAQWRRVLAQKLRGELLQIANKGDAVELNNYLIDQGIIILDGGSEKDSSDELRVIDPKTGEIVATLPKSMGFREKGVTYDIDLDDEPVDMVKIVSGMSADILEKGLYHPTTAAILRGGPAPRPLVQRDLLDEDGEFKERFDDG